MGPMIKKHKNLIKRKYEQENYFLEEYQVHLVNGDILTVYVKVKHGDNEKNHHQEALNIAKEQHPNLEILKVVYC